MIESGMNKRVIGISVIAALAVIIVAALLWPKQTVAPVGPTPAPHVNANAAPVPAPTAPNLPASGASLTPVYANSSAAVIVTDSIGYDLNNALTVIVTGQAAGWYFEASFPVEILDNSNNVIGTGVATAQADWMTAAFVPFVANVTLNAPYSGPATVVLHKDNPSGEPANDASVSYAVTL